MRALIVTSLYPSARRPELGRFVHDQVQALRAIDQVEVEVFSFPTGARAWLRAGWTLRQRHRGKRFDVIHAHFGLSAWPALALRGAPHLVTLHGSDLRDRRSARVTRAALPLLDLVATVSASLADELPGAGRGVAVLPCGVDMMRFRPIPRAQARRRLGLDARGPYLLFPADPARRSKGHAQARALAGDVPLLTLGDVAPDQVPYWVNAANAVVLPTAAEGFGLAALEALACDVPILTTPVGIAPLVLSEIAGAHCGPFDLAIWREQLAEHLRAEDPRIVGRERARLFCAARMARRVAIAWSELAGRSPRGAEWPAAGAELYSPVPLA